MKVSLNVIKQFVDIDCSVDELVQKINQQLGKVEAVTDLSEKYAAPVVVKVVTCVDHPDSDHMHVCRVDDGGVVKAVERGDDGLVQVVCGASNVRAGMFAAWLPPASTVPASFDEKDRFVLGSRELRGVTSHGMLASPRELALGDDHTGILEITEADLLPELEKSMSEDYETREPVKPLRLQPGVSFSALFGLNDTIIDIENKMFTHRPDLFGQFGVAREIFAILQPEVAHGKYTDIQFNEREWYWRLPHFAKANGLELDVFNDAPEKVPRFMAVAYEHVTIGQSPIWLRALLVRLGSKPISNVVDLTNYIMLLTAQPTHAYDYDKLRGHRLGARMARPGEKATLLNGKTYTLDKDDIVIADGDGVVGLAGIMGGMDSEVSAETKNVVLEVATFDMYAVRKSGMRQGIFTEASTRFTKGQSPLQNDRVLVRLMQLIEDYAGATQTSQVYDLPELAEGEYRTSESAEIVFTPEFINERLGLDLTEEQIGNILRFVNFATYRPEEDPSKLVTAAPFWRTDIELPEDVVEEVGRLYGFDKLPRELPKRSITPAPQNPLFETNRKVRRLLAEAGANEVLTYSFVHENLLQKAGQDPAQAFRLGNAISPDLQYYRLSLTPSLLAHVHMNIKAGHDEFALFEIGKAHSKNFMDKEGLPKEFNRLALLYTSKEPRGDSAYFYVKRYVEALFEGLGIRDVAYIPFEDEVDIAATYYEPTRAAKIMVGDVLLGWIGEYSQKVTRAFKVPARTAGFEIDSEAVSELARQKIYKPLSRFPRVTQDISLRVGTDVPYKVVYDCAQKVIDELGTGYETTLLPRAVYQSEDAKDHKTITLRLSIASYEKTLNDQEVVTILDRVATLAQQTVAAERV